MKRVELTIEKSNVTPKRALRALSVAGVRDARLTVNRRFFFCVSVNAKDLRRAKRVVHGRTAKFSVQASHVDVRDMLEANDVPILDQFPSIYVGQVCVTVPEAWTRRAGKVLFG